MKLIIFNLSLLSILISHGCGLDRPQLVHVSLDSSFDPSPSNYIIFVDFIGALIEAGRRPVVALPETLPSHPGVICNKGCLLEASSRSHIPFNFNQFDTISVPFGDEGARAFSHAMYNMTLTFGCGAIPAARSSSAEFNVYVCLHPCLKNYEEHDAPVLAGVLSTYQLVLTMSEFSRLSYHRENMALIDFAMQHDLNTPAVNDIVQPAYMDLDFGAAVSVVPARLDSFRLCVSRVELNREWRDVLHHLVFVFRRVCSMLYKEEQCQLILLVGPPEDQRQFAAVAGVLRRKLPGVEIYENQTFSERQRVILTCDQFWLLTDAPEIFRRLQSGIISSYKPRELIDRDFIFALRCGLVVVALNAGAAPEYVPPMFHKSVSLILANKMTDFGRASAAIIKMARRAGTLGRIQSFSLGFANRISTSHFRSRLSAVLHRESKKWGYISFALKHLHVLRQQELLVDGSSENVALIIESGFSRTMEFAIRNTMLRLGSGWALCVWHSKRNDFFVKRMLADIRNVRFVLMNETFSDRYQFSNWMKTPFLWRQLTNFGYQKVLIFQPDSIMLRGDIDRFMRYDYVGAPWCMDAKGLIDKNNAARFDTKLRIGNGGFSLRTVSAMLNVSATHPIGNSVFEVRELEDVYFVSRMEKDGYAFPTRREAALFAIESFCDSEFFPIFSQDGMFPLGLHAAWRFADDETELPLIYSWLEKYYIAHD